MIAMDKMVNSLKEKAAATGRNLALTSPMPLRHGRAWNPVAPRSNPRGNKQKAPRRDYSSVNKRARGETTRPRGSS
jgi:hypothetical protein